MYTPSNILNVCSDDMEKVFIHLKNEFNKIIAGKANAMMVEGVKVSSYGTLVPINQVASITTSDAVTIVIKPWDKGLIMDIEKAIVHSNFGFNPRNDGNTIFITIPSLTEERRKQLVKAASTSAETCKVAIRNVRKKHKEHIKGFEGQGVSEDEIKVLEDKLQKITDGYIDKVDSLLAAKSKELNTI